MVQFFKDIRNYIRDIWIIDLIFTFLVFLAVDRCLGTYDSWTQSLSFGAIMSLFMTPLNRYVIRPNNDKSYNTSYYYLGGQRQNLVQYAIDNGYIVKSKTKNKTILRLKNLHWYHWSQNISISAANRYSMISAPLTLLSDIPTTIIPLTTVRNI